MSAVKITIEHKANGFSYIKVDGKAVGIIEDPEKEFRRILTNIMNAMVIENIDIVEVED